MPTTQGGKRLIIIIMKQSVLSNLGAFHIVMTEGAGDVAAAAVAMTLVDYTYLTN